MFKGFSTDFFLSLVIFFSFLITFSCSVAILSTFHRCFTQRLSRSLLTLTETISIPSPVYIATKSESLIRFVRLSGKK